MSRLWREEDGLIYIPVATIGLTGSEWLLRLRRQRYKVDEEVERLLVPQKGEDRSQFGTHSVPMRAREAVIVKGYTGKRDALLQLRQERKWYFGWPEIACHLREALSDEDLRDMGLQALSVEMEQPFRYVYRYAKTPTYEQNLLLSLHRNGAYKDNGQPNGGGRHLSVSYTTGCSDAAHGHLFLC